MAKDKDTLKQVPAGGKKPYDPPRILMVEKLEAVAVTCGKQGGEPGACRDVVQS